MLMSWRDLCSSVFAMSDAWFSPVKIWVSNSQVRIVSDVHAAAETLTQSGVQAAAYHAGRSDAERTRVQDAFGAGDVTVVCATNAFGMGIDRPDVEAVIHMDIPCSLEAYYQEI